jgi:hypothetical protein
MTPDLGLRARVKQRWRSAVSTAARILDGVASGAYLYRLSMSARQYAGLVSDCILWCAGDQ